VNAQLEPVTSSEPSGSRQRRISTTLIVAVFVVLLFAWQWYDNQLRFQALQQQAAQARALQTQLATFENQLGEVQNRQAVLESLYQDLSHSGDDAMLADIEQTLLITDQQLQITGNIKTALAALQAADARLARGDRSEFTPIRKALAHDIARLQHAPTVDFAGISARLDSVLGTVDALPLAMDVRSSVTPSAPQPASAGENVWQRLAHALWQELRALVRIQNTEHTDSALLAPQEIFLLRENLKLRLLSARLALLARDDTSFKTDLKTAQKSLARYFASNDPAVAVALATAQQLTSDRIDIAPPDVAASLAAMRDYRLAHEPR
jgi:uroporphyrin-3 C-methyltransferase